MHWFPADPHFSHHRIIGFCGRPFPDVATMDAQLLAECRSRVGPDDDLWVLGDFTAGSLTDAQRRKVRGIFHALPGRKHLIRGNHDEDWICDLPWDSVSETADIVVDKRRLFLCHYPMITWPGARHNGLQLFGHVHQNWRGSRNSVNVGVDVWNFRPVTLPEIERRAAELSVNAHWDQVEPGRALPTAICASCGRILDPALASGQAVVRNGRIVLAATHETIAFLGEAVRQWLPDGRHICPECIGSYLTVEKVTMPVGFAFNETANRAVPRGNRMPPRNALDKTSVEDRLLAGIDMICASDACRLLHIETDDPEGAMQAMVQEGAVIALVQNGKTMVPLFQFDLANGRVFDVVGAILQLRPPRISNLRLVYWMTRLHIDFGGSPADCFGKDDVSIVAAFRRYIEPECHG